ncbi:MAG: hypothetical protein HC893_03545 [Chloroflexaceae bacterium]|nr:hypothetical protein [Chloroflexaceae bacterium]
MPWHDDDTDGNNRSIPWEPGSLVWPVPLAGQDAALLCIPGHLVPLVGGLFSQFEHRDWYVDSASWEQGKQVALELQEQLMTNCLSSLIQEIRNARGLRPDAVPVPDPITGQPTYNPENDYYTLGDIRAASAEIGAILLYATGAMDFDESSLSETWSNLMQAFPHSGFKAVQMTDFGELETSRRAIGRLAQGGTVPEGWLWWKSDRRITLADLYRSMNAGAAENKLLNRIQTLLSTGAFATSLVNAGINVIDFFGDRAGDIAEDSIAGANTILMLSVIALLSQQQQDSQQQQADIQAILQALRGTTPPEPVSDSHNVLSRLKTLLAPEYIEAQFNLYSLGQQQQENWLLDHSLLQDMRNHTYWLAWDGEGYVGVAALRDRLQLIQEALRGITEPSGVSDQRNVIAALNRIAVALDGKTLEEPGYSSEIYNVVKDIQRLTTYLGTYITGDQGWAAEPFYPNPETYNILTLLNELLLGSGGTPAAIAVLANNLNNLSARLGEALAGSTTWERQPGYEDVTLYNVVVMLDVIIDWIAGLDPIKADADFIRYQLLGSGDEHSVLRTIDYRLENMLTGEGSLPDRLQKILEMLQEIPSFSDAGDPPVLGVHGGSVRSTIDNDGALDPYLSR